MRSVTANYRPITPAKVDGRTRIARLAASTREGLLEHLGHAPSATEAMLVERCVQLSIRIALMDQRFAEQPEMPESEAGTYLNASAALTRLLRQLSLEKAKSKLTTAASLREQSQQGAAA